MEKTIRFALKEAIEMGRRSAMPAFIKRELREQIAQEIEQGKYTWLGADSDPDKVRKIIKRAAEIARGTND